MVRRVRRSAQVARRKGLTPLEKAQVARMMNVRHEKKYFQNYAAGTRDWSGVIHSVSDVAQGDSDVNRDGDSLYIKSLQIRYSIAVADTYNLVRLICFQWLDDDTPIPSDILSATYLGTAVAPLAPFHHDQRAKYRILYDSQPMALNGTSNLVEVRTVMLKNRGKLGKKMVNQIRYTAGLTTGSNKLYILEISDSSAAAHPSFSTVARMNFTDN